MNLRLCKEMGVNVMKQQSMTVDHCFIQIMDGFIHVLGVFGQWRLCQAQHSFSHSQAAGPRVRSELL